MIENRGRVQMPITAEGVTWTTERKGVPGKLNFTVIKDSALDFTEGNAVKFSVDGKNIFFGFVFTKKRSKEHHIDVTAYDQIRYLLNKDTYVYGNRTASELIQMIAADFGLQTGQIDRTSFIISSRVEDNTTLLDMIYNALDLELTNRGNMFVLYDDFGRLTLKSLDSMKLNIIIDEETGENFDYTSTIDDSTYNRVKLSFENEETGKRDIYLMQDGNNINNWGILQYFDKLKKGENGEVKAAALLSLYNSKTRKLKISRAFGDTRVRGGSLVIVRLNLGDVNIQNYMVVEKVTHTFNESEHYMDLTLRGSAPGGDFIG